MATWKTHKCNSCDYFFTGSGKPDALFKGYMLPVVCSRCNEIYDRIIHTPIGEKLNGKCEECDSKIGIIELNLPYKYLSPYTLQ